MKYDTKRAIRTGVIKAGGYAALSAVASTIGVATGRLMASTPNKIKKGVFAVNGFVGAELVAVMTFYKVTDWLDELIPKPEYTIEEIEQEILTEEL